MELETHGRSMLSGRTPVVAIKSVAHFSIPVSDIGKSTRFYTEVVGCRHLTTVPRGDDGYTPPWRPALIPPNWVDARDQKFESGAGNSPLPLAGSPHREGPPTEDRNTLRAARRARDRIPHPCLAHPP
jgi:catechol 2,3-dioxygenase-like lactoylglutathione lyase family enzyme